MSNMVRIVVEETFVEALCKDPDCVNVEFAPPRRILHEVDVESEELYRLLDPLAGCGISASFLQIIGAIRLPPKENG